MNEKYRACKDCGKHIPYVKRKVRCSICVKTRNNVLRNVRRKRQLGGIPMTIKQHKIVYKATRFPYKVKGDVDVEQEERDRATLNESDGQWVREQLYNFRFDIVEFETNQQRKERKLTEYKQWIEGNL